MEKEQREKIGSRGTTGEKLQVGPNAGENEIGDIEDC
jgi:hypothetical protein